MHVELNETRKRNEEKKEKFCKPFIYKEIDFPAISKDRARKHSGKYNLTGNVASLLRIETRRFKKYLQLQRLKYPMKSKKKREKMFQI